MARAGDIVRLPGGERVVFRRMAAETGGELLELEAHYASGGRPPPEHYHPDQEERFEGLSGTVTVRVGGSERTLGPGETLVVAPGVRHTFWNAGTEEAVVRWEVRPALATQEFFEQLGQASQRRGSMLLAALVVRRHPDEFRLAQPPWPLQRVLFAALAPVARLIGFPGR